ERTRQLRDVQEELVRKEKMSIVGELSSSVGHELRNPLGVMSNAVFFLKILHADADTTTREYLEIIKQEIDTSLRIITDLLDFAQIQSPQRQPVNVAELVRHALGTCTIPGNVTVIVAIPAEVPTLDVDRTQLEQVLANCFTNAVQAMPEGGTLRVAAQSPSTDANNFVEIAVTDSGEGIAPENLGHIFQPLFSTRINGLGLGLVVSKNLVEANGGRINVESEWGKGATFTLQLPVEKEEK
ncbi:MAG: ATP-binding protein, partial [Desulfuromonadales bacterium]|nr:ATP-binding protein [Desulfuromonadales bacterium]